VDTRAKILDPAAAVRTACRAKGQGKRVKLVTGYFDPLLAEHARGLSAVAEGGAVLFVLVRQPERPILAARARAELVAALGVVDYVVLGEAVFSADEVHDEGAADERRTRDLILHVRNRQS
jgi:bifunctional ADP-heptose synthase (sugar kinase/adenylyltransferase)